MEKLDHIKTEQIIKIDFDNAISSGPSYFGTNGWWTDQDAELFQLRYDELGAKVIRLPVIQGIIEPSNDNNDPGRIAWDRFHFDKSYPYYNRTITYQKWFESLRDLGVKIIIYFPYISGWLSNNGDKNLQSTYPPRNYEEYREFIYVVLRYLVEKLSYPPEDIILEPINEPDLRCGQDELVECFWENWQLDDIRKIFRAAFEARNKVSQDIFIIGLSQCCGINLTERFLDDYGGNKYLDGFSYHCYVEYNAKEIIERGNRFKKFDKPVFINEYGNRRFWSNGIEGALWHSHVLSHLWKSNINPIQFPVSEFKGNGNDYRELGLFKDWTEKWQIKPAFWVYRNFYKYMSNSTIIWTETELPLDVVAVKSKEGVERAVIWITNAGEQRHVDTKIIIENILYKNLKVDVHTNLLDESYLKTIEIDHGINNVQFIYDIPGKSSICFIVTKRDFN